MFKPGFESYKFNRRYSKCSLDFCTFSFCINKPVLQNWFFVLFLHFYIGCRTGIFRKNKIGLSKNITAISRAGSGKSYPFGMVKVGIG